MLKNQHTYAEISADRSITIPLQPPHLLYFDTLTLPDQKEKLTLSHKVSFVFFKFSIIYINSSRQPHLVDAHLPSSEHIDIHQIGSLNMETESFFL